MDLVIVSIEETRQALYHLLDVRNENVWMSFGTLPFYVCSNNPDDLGLLKRLYNTKNATVRNDPDGRSRLNINIFNGDTIVIDFGYTPTLGIIQTSNLLEAYQKRHESKIDKDINCHDPAGSYLGPNILVKIVITKIVNLKIILADKGQLVRR